MTGHDWRSDKLAIGGLALLMIGAMLLVVKLLLEVAHIIGAGLVLTGLALIVAAYFMRKG